MKNKKLFLPTIILVVAILVTAAYSVISSIARTPAITEAEFPFSITYELDGEMVTIKDVYRVRYVENDGKTRLYVGEIGDMGEDNTIYTLKKGKNTRIELWTHFYSDYMIGDPYYDYFDTNAFEPRIYYYDASEIEYSDEASLSEQGVRLISYEYPTPVENSFVFSHISYLTGDVIILPTLAIAVLALIAMMIFVKKEKELKYKAIDIVAIVINFIICFALVPFISFAALLIDAEVGGPEVYYQVLYLVPAFLVLCVAASVALRRKGYGVKSLISELSGIAFLAVYFIVCGVGGLL